MAIMENGKQLLFKRMGYWKRRKVCFVISRFLFAIMRIDWKRATGLKEFHIFNEFGFRISRNILK